MRAYNFIKERLDGLVASFPAVNVIYGYNEDINTHVIKVTSDPAFYEQEELSKICFDIDIAFGENFPDDDITFISADSFIEIITPLFIHNPVPTQNKLLLVIFDQFLNSRLDNETKISQGGLSFVSNTFFTNQPEKRDFSFVQQSTIFNYSEVKTPNAA